MQISEKIEKIDWLENQIQSVHNTRAAVSLDRLFQILTSRSPSHFSSGPAPAPKITSLETMQQHGNEDLQSALAHRGRFQPAE
jgi:hypothetical protein